jgi:hypothetical protein
MDIGTDLLGVGMVFVEGANAPGGQEDGLGVDVGALPAMLDGYPVTALPFHQKVDDQNPFEELGSGLAQKEAMELPSRCIPTGMKDSGTGMGRLLGEEETARLIPIELEATADKVVHDLNGVTGENLYRLHIAKASPGPNGIGNVEGNILLVHGPANSPLGIEGIALPDWIFGEDEGGAALGNMETCIQTGHSSTDDEVIVDHREAFVNWEGS